MENEIVPGSSLELSYSGLTRLLYPEVVIYGGQRYVVEPSEEVAADVKMWPIQVGDFVEVLNDTGELDMVGEFGKVVSFIEDDCWGVEFAEPKPDVFLNSLDGSTAEEHGRYYKSSDLGVVD